METAGGEAAGGEWKTLPAGVYFVEDSSPKSAQPTAQPTNQESARWSEERTAQEEQRKQEELLSKQQESYETEQQAYHKQQTDWHRQQQAYHKRQEELHRRQYEGDPLLSTPLIVLLAVLAFCLCLGLYVYMRRR